MRSVTLWVLPWILVACGGHSQAPGGGDGGTPAAHIRVAPDGASVTVVDNVPVTQGYTATLLNDDGTETDVTSTVTWSLADPADGTFSGPTLSVGGQGAGPTRVQATLPDAFGDAGLTIFVKGTRVEGGAPVDSAGLFDGATENPARAPTIAYPSDGILVPPNLGQFDVHWTDATTNNVWQLEMSNAYIDIRIFTTGLDPAHPRYTLFTPEDWYPIASTKSQLTLVVAGLDTAAPATKGTAPAQHVDVTNDIARGAIYYWTTSGNASIFRYDLATPGTPPTPFFPIDQRPSTCMGCHALSHDGSKIAMTLDDPDGRGTVLNVADRTQTIFYDGSQPGVIWDYATFNPDATKLLTLLEGVMQLRDVSGGAALGAALPNTPGLVATHPEISPDGTRLVNVEQTGGASFQDLFCANGTIVTRPFDDANNTFGASTILVPADPANQIANFYPSFSPDGQWLAFTRTTGQSYSDPSAETWVIKADGSAPPIRLAAADAAGAVTNSWARWVPFAATFGAANEPLFYLTFSTERPFGVRIPAGGQPQIWMTPFFPDRAAAGMDPSGPAFHVPFQDVTTNNHIAQWTTELVGPIQ